MPGAKQVPEPICRRFTPQKIDVVEGLLAKVLPLLKRTSYGSGPIIRSDRNDCYKPWADLTGFPLTCFDSRTCAQKFAGEQTRAKHFADGSKRGVVFALKLRFDSGLVDDRPYFLDPFVSKLIEYVFAKQDSLPVYMEAK